MQQRNDRDEPKDPEWSDAFLTTVYELAIQAAKARLVRREVRQDIAQDIVLFFLERIRAGRLTNPPRHLTPLVTRMMRQRAGQRARSEAARTVREANYATENPRHLEPWMNPDESLRERELDAARARVLERVPEPARRLHQLVREEDLGYSAAAAQLGLTRKVARRQLDAVEDEFRQALAECDVPVPKWRSREDRLQPRYRKRS